MSAPAETSFAAKYGRSAHARVSFARNRGFSIDDVLVNGNDSLEDVTRKTANCRSIIEGGGSLAVILDLLPSDGSEPTGVPEATQNMSTEEAEMWEDFLGGLKLPPCDLLRDRAAPEAGESKKRRDERRLLAFRTLYDDNTLVRENLAWFYKTHSYLIPLVTAADKVMGAKAAASNGGKRDPREQAELVAANRLQAAASTRQAAILVEVNRLKGEIAYNLGAVQARRVAMQPEPEEGKKKVTVRYDEVRKAKGKEAVGMPKSWNREGARGRIQALGEGLRQTQGQKRRADNEPGPSRSVRQRSSSVVSGEQTRAGARPSGPGQRDVRFGVRAASPVYRPTSPSDQMHDEDEMSVA